MNIRNVDVFDLYGDGTLVIKTNAEGAGDNTRYAWYVRQGKRNIFKGAYQAEPFMSYDLPTPGDYTIKAFVKNQAGEKAEKEVAFHANRRTSPLLASDSQLQLEGGPQIEHISGPFYRMSLRDERLPEDARYAWYIYRKDEKEPFARQMYSDSSEYVFAFQDPGEYYVKVFVILDNAKNSLKSDLFTVR